MVICLDPAAPYSGDLPERLDITYFVVHPCHPPIVKDETDPAARADFFGGVAQQDIVCALMQGPEADYERGVAIARRMFAPVLRAHRVTVEQMAILEPAMTETVILTCMMVMREAVDEAIRAACRRRRRVDFALGHMGVNAGMLYGFVDVGPLGRRQDGRRARPRGSLFQADWKKVFKLENVIKEVKAITESTAIKKS